MTETDGASGDQPADIFTELLRLQGEAARQVMQAFAPDAVKALPSEQDAEALGASILALQDNWLKLWSLPPAQADGGEALAPLMADPAQWLEVMQAQMQGLYARMPALDPLAQQEIWQEWAALWQQIAGQFNAAGEDAPATPALPRKDRRFADPAWQQQPVFALIHQTYLLLAEKVGEAVDTLSGVTEAEREQLRFATRSVMDAMSPANFPLMNPVVLERTIATQGENLVKGMERLAHDLEAGQLTHADASRFVLGENVAATPGQVIHRDPLYEVIQYSPATEQVLAVPLVIFPPWINRFYILDLNPAKSFVRWAVEQGITVVLVSWKSADASMADVTMDDYARAQIAVIDLVRERLQVPAVHTLGYCVAGTTLAATLAVLARRGQADKVASVTFLTAQVDFEHAGDLKLFTEDTGLELVKAASTDGYLDGRYMAATFNLLRGTDLIWNTVVNHYLLGQDYPAFDLLFWNGDVTNLPARWHRQYLDTCYRRNALVVPDAVTLDGTAVDLGLVEVPAYVQAGREDHIAPPESVLRLPQVLSGPVRFVLAGSGHIAGVVNPPSSGKYQYWTGPQPSHDGVATVADFVAAATEHPGSWWPDWHGWLQALAPDTVSATGRRKPGGKGNPALEPAPGSYVRLR
ncbi:PHA/PHB synthase family protein [Alteraurantiacibacter buctensis]|uniref:Alpha/beta fold hydrolase n=1 Tax=Alteraurantiacibacter buctensis TaxID=1503981 RepID=A0A844Z1G6_9SPHN|nr:alpha/beta fold hydrolase [Alteraurantiacibacter buctensis]MXO73188.1 alpha/beta fold hydrolase [Alteraurantiacibacter buctensis]